ncbi:MAG: hypothetical protein J0H42_29535 [Rhizobiales bacterium]|nr:hypothetical protein [Hyphomicrobiales bacterium]
MSSIEDKDVFTLPATRPRPRRWRATLALMTQYTIVTIMVCLAVVYILRYMVTPQIVAKFELIAAALKR